MFWIHLMTLVFFSSEPSIHASSCGAAIPITPTSARPRKGLPLMALSVPQEK